MDKKSYSKQGNPSNTYIEDVDTGRYYYTCEEDVPTSRALHSEAHKVVWLEEAETKYKEFATESEINKLQSGLSLISSFSKELYQLPELYLKDYEDFPKYRGLNGSTVSIVINDWAQDSKDSFIKRLMLRDSVEGVYEIIHNSAPRDVLIPTAEYTKPQLQDSSCYQLARSKKKVRVRMKKRKRPKAQTGWTESNPNHGAKDCDQNLTTEQSAKPLYKERLLLMDSFKSARSSIHETSIADDKGVLPTVVTGYSRPPKSRRISFTSQDSQWEEANQALHSVITAPLTLQKKLLTTPNEDQVEKKRDKKRKPRNTS